MDVLKFYSQRKHSHTVEPFVCYLHLYAGGLHYDRAQVIDSGGLLNFGMRPDVRHIGSGRSNRGIYVRSEYPIDLFGSNEEKFSHDCFLVLPTTVLGK